MPLYVRTLLSTASPEEIAEATPGHRAQLRELRARGRLRAAGEFKDGDGFLEIFEADDVREADAIARASPLVADGLVAWIVREWSESDLG
jgi:uncharacterized protein YciI